jgi:replication-associated recombination protein RarA
MSTSLFGTEPAAGSFNFPEPLAERYRPRKVNDFIGLDKTRKVLNAFCAKPFPSSWLFVGPPGVGKSSMALALKDELGAEFHHVPSQKCTVAEIDQVIRLCWYLPHTAGGFHLVLVDEADRMTPAAQLALLSKLDSTDPPPNTIFVFTCNSTEGLEKRFLSRCSVLEFSSYGMRDELATFLGKVWQWETGKPATMDFQRLAKDSTNNVRDALMQLQVAILGS